MSYRNPTIVKDDSGSVLGQAIAQGAQNIAKGIIGMEKQNQLARERKEKQLAKDKKENEERNNAIIVNAEKANRNKQQQAANIEKYAQNVDAGAKEYYAELALEKDGLTNINMYNPTQKNTEKMVNVMGRVNDYNTLIINTGSMQQQALKHQQLGAATLNGNVVYPSINGDTGANAILINNGMSAANGYGYRLEPSTKNDEKQDKLVILHPEVAGEKRKETVFSHQEVKNMGPLWSLKDQNMVTDIQKNSKNSMILVQQGGKEVTNPGMLETRNVPGATANASGEVPQEPVMQNKATGRVNDGGYYINESQLDTQLFNAQVSSQQQDTVSNIDSFQTAHDRSSYLLDLNISPEEYEKLDAKGKTQAINASVKDIMLKTYNVREEEGSYFRETQGAKVPNPRQGNESNPALTRDEYYTQANTNISTGLTPYVAESPTPDGYKENVLSQLNKLFKFDKAGNGNSMDFYLGGKSKKSDSNFRDLKFEYEKGKLILRSSTGTVADMDEFGDKNSKANPIASAWRIVDLINVNNKTSMSFEQKGKLAKLIEEKLGSNFLTGKL